MNEFLDDRQYIKQLTKLIFSMSFFITQKEYFKLIDELIESSNA